MNPAANQKKRISEGKTHECCICLKVFETGQQLGGHMSSCGKRRPREYTFQELWKPLKPLSGTTIEKGNSGEPDAGAANPALNPNRGIPVFGVVQKSQASVMEEKEEDAVRAFSSP